MYLSSDVDKKIYQYSLITPWDINSAVYSDISFSTGTRSTNSITFSTDGTKMYHGYNNWYQYSLPGGTFEGIAKIKVGY
jgi:hypothetical protein